LIGVLTGVPVIKLSAFKKEANKSKTATIYFFMWFPKEILNYI